MSDREVPFEQEAICDRCGAKGAYDFMGDYYCVRCTKELVDEEVKP